MPEFAVLEVALEDIESGCMYYKKQSPGLEDRFLNAVEETFDRIIQSPLQYVEKYEFLRMAKVNKFPYWVYFRFDDDFIQVAAVFHESRNPEILEDRI